MYQRNLATGLHLPGTWGVGSPSALRGQVTANWPFEAKRPSCTTWRASSQYSDLKMQMPWILARSGDRTKRNRWVESTPLPACTKTKDPSVSCINLEYLACLSLWPQVPSSETFPITLLAQKARPAQAGESSVPTHYHQHSPGSGALSALGANCPWWVTPLLTSQEQFSHHLAGCGSASLIDESWDPEAWSTLSHHPPIYYYEQGSVMAEVQNLRGLI